MAQQTREIRRRIKAVNSTKKITKAMELVASAKMRRVTQALLQTRPYTDWSRQLLKNLSERTDGSMHPLLEKRTEVKRQALILLSTNRGLVGAFNANLTTAAMRVVNDAKAQGIETDLILMGTKGRAIVHRYGIDAVADFPKAEVASSVQDVHPLSKLVIGDFLRKQVDRVMVVFMDYQSTLVQKPVIRQLLPLDEAAFTKELEGMKEDSPVVSQTEYTFEPNADLVLELLLERLVEIQLYRALLETNASEQAARMMAMRNASDAAGELIDELTLSFNQARQASITQDLAEISAGRAALES